MNIIPESVAHLSKEQQKKLMRTQAPLVGAHVPKNFTEIEANFKKVCEQLQISEKDGRQYHMYLNRYKKILVFVKQEDELSLSETEEVLEYVRSHKEQKLTLLQYFPAAKDSIGEGLLLIETSLEKDLLPLIVLVEHHYIGLKNLYPSQVEKVEVRKRIINTK